MSLWLVVAAVIAALAVVGVVLWRRWRQRGREISAIERTTRDPSRAPEEELAGWMDRWDGRLAIFMRRVGLALLVMMGLLLVSLTINITLVASQRADDRAQVRQSQINAAAIARDRRATVDRRQRAADTDRAQCVAIEKLKRSGRVAIRRGIARIRRSQLSVSDKAGFIADSLVTLRDYAALVVHTSQGTELRGLAACDALPNSPEGGAK